VKIALDIGHIGKRSRPDDKGASHNGYVEADLVLDYVVAARKHLENAGHLVFLMAHDNYNKRHDFCTDMALDLHMQCHLNSPDGRYSLIMIRDDASDDTIALTEIMSHKFKQWMGSTISKVDVKKLKGDDRGYACIAPDRPSLLLEPLFLKNDNHLKFLIRDDGIILLGKAIAESVNEWSQVIG